MRNETAKGELKEAPNESFQKKYAPGEFDFGGHQLDTPEERKNGEKPKYNKNNDFFDSITNSTLEEK